MGKRSGVPPVMRGVLGWSWERLAISVHGLRERRRRLSNSLHNSALRNRQTLLLHGDDPRAVHQQILRADLVGVACIPRYFL